MSADLEIEAARPDVTRLALYATFFKIGISGFGGVGPWARRVIVEEREWLDDREYADVLALCQVLPGPNVGNVAVTIGDRFHGALGSALALGGLMSGPVAIVLVLAILYDRFGSLPVVDGAIGGVAAAAAGLVIGTALKIIGKLKPTADAIMIGLLAFVAVGLLRWPLLPVVLTLAPLSIAAAWRRRRAAGRVALAASR
ncbi:MAG: chromate transporter [Chloroflexota bacterium]|nr:chromate transporter [Chloroflexota bacterium]